MTLPPVSFQHLFRMSDGVGLYEHAKLTSPRIEHGYCVDDVARGLLVAARQPAPTQALTELAGTYLRFVAAAQCDDGTFHNRCGRKLVWQDEPSFDDCWGRALWGLGTAVARSPALAKQALVLFDLSASGRSKWPRAMAFAALGAAEVLLIHPDHVSARALLTAAAAAIGSPGESRGWLWTEPRLRYANAALPDVLLAAGALLGDAQAHADGLAMLSWLHDIERCGDHISVTPVGGWASGEPRPAFDQQPIEVASLADAYSRAYDVTGDQPWSDGVLRCAAWFLGCNDGMVPLLDPVSGGCCDGLERSGRNENQGAESTLAMISTLQQGHRILALQP